VRNMLHDGRLQGRRTTSGQRANIWRVYVDSIDEFRRNHDDPGRTRAADALSERVTHIEQRLSRLEQERSSTPTTGAEQLTNLRYANLRLMQISEDYERVMSQLLAADQYRQDLLSTLAKIAANYRAVVQQFHLPDVPPDML